MQTLATDRWNSFISENWPRVIEANHLQKLQEEFDEFMENPVPEEAVDMIIVLMTWAFAAGEDLDKALTAKIEKNEGRTWEFRNGVYKHVNSEK